MYFNPATPAAAPRFLPACPPLCDEIRAVVDTAVAAYHLNRSPQTLRTWACYEDGPIRPQRINGKLAWSVADLRRIVGVSA